jgi:predicted thioesterase
MQEKTMSSTEKLKPGLKGSSTLTVAEEHTAPRVGSGRVHVLATPVMINVIEAAALAAIEHLLPEGYQSLGTRLDIRHFAATPVGMRVRAEVEVEKSRSPTRRSPSATARTSAWSSTCRASTCACRRKWRWFAAGPDRAPF